MCQMKYRFNTIENIKMASLSASNSKRKVITTNAKKVLNNINHAFKTSNNTTEIF